MDTPLEKIKKLTEMTRREFIKRGSAAAGMSKIPGQGLQSLVKEIPLDFEDLYRQQAGLKKRIVEYLGSSVLGPLDKPGGFGGIQHTLDSPEAKEAGKKYFNVIMNQYQKLTDIMEAQANPNMMTAHGVRSPVEVGGGAKKRKPKSFRPTLNEINRDVQPRNIKKTVYSYPLSPTRQARLQVHVEAGLGNIGKVGRPVNKELLDEAVTRAEREVTAPKSLTRDARNVQIEMLAEKATYAEEQKLKSLARAASTGGWSELAPADIVDRPTNYKTWHEAEKELRDDLLEREKTTGRTLVTRSAGVGKTLPIGSPFPEALPSKPAPKKLEGPQTERTTKPVEPERTTKPKEPERKPKPSTSPRLTRTASPPPQFPSGKDLSRIALRGAANLAGWPMYAASFGIPSARSGESQVLAELADQPDADFETALKEYRQRLAQQKETLKLRRQQENLGPIGMS